MVHVLHVRGKNVVMLAIEQEEAEFIAESLPRSDGAQAEWEQIAEALREANNPEESETDE